MKTLIAGLFSLSLLVAPVFAEAASTLNWVNNATDATATEIERAPGVCATPGTFAVVVSLAPTATTYVDTTVAQGATYCYRLRALRDTTYSAYSALAQFAPPLAPSGLTAR